MTKNTNCWVYHWLRWSVFITVPWMIVNLGILELLFYPASDWGYMLAVFVPALAHGILFLGMASPSLYARRHTQQAFMLVGLRVLSAWFFVGLLQESGACLWIIVSGFLWVWGSIWGLRQIERGDCWLMRWYGEDDALPRPADAAAIPITGAPAVAPAKIEPTAVKLATLPDPIDTPVPMTPPPAVHLPPETSVDPNAAYERGLSLLQADDLSDVVDCFLAAFRTGPPDLRCRALIELEKLGEVETF